MLSCIFCCKLLKNKNSKTQHEIFCKQNPNRVIRPLKAGALNPMFGKSGSNQFIKAQALGLVVEVNSQTRQKISQANQNQLWTPERRKKLSESMLAAVKRNPASYSASNVSGRAKMYDFGGLRFKGTWELKVAMTLKSAGISYTNILDPIEYQWQNRSHLYFPDFYLNEHDLYLEVKGYERERDLAKWRAVKNLVVLKKPEIMNLDVSNIRNILGINK